MRIFLLIMISFFYATNLFSYSNSIRLDGAFPITSQNENIKKSPQYYRFDGRFFVLYLDSTINLNTTYHSFNDFSNQTDFLHQPITSDNMINLYLTKKSKVLNIGVTTSYDKLTSSNYFRGVNFFLQPIKKGDVLYSGLNLYTPHNGLNFKSYYFNEQYLTSQDTIYAASIFNEMSLYKSDFFPKIDFRFNAIYKPLLGNSVLNDTLKSDYYKLSTQLSKKDLFLRNLKIGIGGIYIDGSSIKQYVILQPSSSYSVNVGNFNFIRLEWQQNYSMYNSYIISQHFDFEVYRNFFTSNYHNYGYLLKASLIDKFSELSYSFRAEGSYWIKNIMYIKPQFFGIIQMDLSDFTTRNCFEIGTYLANKVNLFVAPNLDLISTIHKFGSKDEEDSGGDGEHQDIPPDFNFSLKLGVRYSE